jgi:acetone carboxylase alpha subunit
MVYLGRAIKANSGGAGKYRGGCGFETLRMIWKAKDWAMTFMGDGYVVCNWGMMGGYPSSAGYRFCAHNTGLKERIENGESLPLGHDWDPDHPEWEKSLWSGAEVIRDKQTMATEQAFEDYDLYLNLIRGGPGFGDPIERSCRQIEADLNGHYVLPRFAQSTYGAVISQDAKGLWKVDDAATAKRREEMKKERIARSVPVRDWIHQERQRVVVKDAAVHVRHMYASSFSGSKKFLEEFRKFWDLPKSWILRLGEEGIEGFGQMSIPLDSLPDVRRVVLVDESVERPEDY